MSSCRAAKESGDWKAKIADFTAAYETNLVDSKRMNWEVIRAAKEANFTEPEHTALLANGTS